MTALSYCVPVILSRVFVLIFSADFHFTSAIYIFYIFRGIVSDLVPTYIAGYAISFIPARRPWRFAGIFFWVLTCILSAANAEHIIVNLGNLDLRYTSLGLNPTMVKGSVITFRVLLLMALILVLSTAIVLFCRGYFRRLLLETGEKQVIEAVIPSKPLVSVYRRATRTVPLFAILGCSLLLLPTNYSVFTCLQMGLIEENILKTYYNVYSRVAAENYPLDETTRSNIFGQDLDAPLFVERAGQKYNVLLILVESIGYETIRSGLMPNLNNFADRALFYPRYLVSQKQTNRGMYNVLCGDYPNLVTHKSKAGLLTTHNANREDQRTCLPGFLQKNGYKTVFLQSAPMKFMNKDKFIPAMGFDESCGDGSFKKVLGRAGWGVDDRTLYFAALEKIDELNLQPRPWFMTLLTVGTHHPYRPVEGAASNYDTAVRYADNALGEFLAGLEKSGSAQNTIVVITTDESHGPLNGGNIPLIARNHGFMVVRLPGQNGGPKKSPVEDLFAAHDLEISLADYLGFETDGMSGRSLFRRYNREGRDLIFGHTYAGIFYYLKDKNLHVCNYDYQCSRYSLKGKFFEDYNYIFEGYENDTSILKSIIQYNDWRD